ncbi:MAG: hypothetical protein ACK5KU_04955, partial [Beutenbergiaceae bacterium]
GSLWLLRRLPLLWLVSVGLDAVIVALVALFGEAVAFPGMAPQNMHPIQPGILIFGLVGATIVSAADWLIARRLPTSAGPAFLALGIATAIHVVFLVATWWANPLMVTAFQDGDSGQIQIAPGPFGYQFVRAGLLAAILLARTLAAVWASSRDVGTAIRASRPHLRKRPPAARLAALAYLVAAGSALTIMIVNGVAAYGVIDQAAALALEDYRQQQIQTEVLLRAGALTAALLVAAVASIALVRWFLRGAASTAPAVIAGLASIGWPILLISAALFNPASWGGSSIWIGTQFLTLEWYPATFTTIAWVMFAALLLSWVSLVIPGVARWLVLADTAPEEGAPE